MQKTIVTFHTSSALYSALQSSPYPNDHYEVTYIHGNHSRTLGIWSKEKLEKTLGISAPVHGYVEIGDAIYAYETLASIAFSRGLVK